jgi:hypothetical protein
MNGKKDSTHKNNQGITKITMKFFSRNLNPMDEKS